VSVWPELIVETVACRLCGSTRYRNERSGPDYFMRLPGVFHLVRCEHCGLLYQNPRPPLSDIGRYYPDHYGSYGSAQAGLRTQSGLMGWVIRRGMNKRCRLIDRAVPALAGRPRRHLDVGCASGLFMEALQSHGWQVEGVELNETAARTTSARLGVPVFVGPFEEADYPDASFDAVTMWDVLEHLHDPLASLRELRRIVRPGGVLFVRVPNAASYVARLCGRYWVGYDLPRHMVVFTPKTLKRALAQAGFEQIVCTYTSGSYLVVLHSLRFAMDDGLVSPQRAAAIHRVLLHPVSRALVWLPFRLADRVAGGSTLEMLVR
jgi:SAM-dependent methyltransferase